MSERIQYMLLSLPSSGSDFVARCVVTGHPTLSYFREFFNPITNLDCYDELSMEFGCELVETIKNIARPYRPNRSAEFEAVYLRTWCKTMHTFTKENYHAFQARWFFYWFRCFALYRDWQGTFPPSRLRTIAWYAAIWESLLINEECSDLRDLIAIGRERARTVQQKCVAAHTIMSVEMMRALNVNTNGPKKPLLYEVLMKGSRDKVAWHLRERMPDGLNYDAIAEAIYVGRESKPRDPKFLYQWHGCDDVFAAIADAAKFRELVQ